MIITIDGEEYEYVSPAETGVVWGTPEVQSYWYHLLIDNMGHFKVALSVLTLKGDWILCDTTNVYCESNKWSVQACIDNFWANK